MKTAALFVLAAFATPATAESVSDVFKRVRDSVVVINTVQTALPETPGGELMLEGGLGSGVLVDPIGIVVTASHVVQVAEAIEVEFTNGEIIPAIVKGSVPAADLAVLKLERPPSDPVAVELGDSDLVEVGDQIFIVGAPLGVTHTLTVGHISARRSTGALYGGLMSAEMLQTDAAINHGNSGGPMFSMDGRVVGIVSHMLSQSGGYEGLGFVMTSNLAREVLFERRPLWTGFEGYVLEGELARSMNLPQELGILVQSVADGSLADRLGLRGGTIRAEIAGESVILGGDVILEVGGFRLSDEGAVDRIRDGIAALGPASEVRLTVLRAGRRIELEGAAR